MNDNKEEVAEIQEIINNLTSARYDELYDYAKGKKGKLVPTPMGWSYRREVTLKSTGRTLTVHISADEGLRTASLNFETPDGIDLIHASGGPSGVVVEAQPEKVDHPVHYQSSSIECIDAIAAATEGLSGEAAFCVGNIIKYLWRKDRKNGVEDLRKARWYLDRLIGKGEK